MTGIAEMQKQKEDIQILLSTLEDAFREASITEEHYNEVKGKNQKKLDEITANIEKMEKAAAKKAAKDERAAERAAAKEERTAKKAARKAGKGRKAASKPEPAPISTPTVALTAPVTPPSTPAAPSSPTEPSDTPTDYSGIPQPLTDVAGADEVTEETKPDKAPGGVRTAEPGTLKYTAEEVKEMFGKLLKEIKPQGLEVAPRVEKLEIQFEKLNAYLDSIKDERSSGKEGLQRLTEEIGEIRSTVSGLDRKISESEIKVSEVSESLGDLRPQRFLKTMREEDAAIKKHEARIEKLDDLTSVMLKKLGQIEDVLKRLGSLEKIVNFSREAAKRLLEIENREKRISRIADKIDGIFMELNKRLDEFVLYKAKQDTLDELSQEMMKSLDEMNTKLQKYAEKGDLDMLRDTLETELVSIRAGAGASPEVKRLQSQKTEIESLIAMLDEQFKAGTLKEDEYKKTRQINLDRLGDIEKKLSGASEGAPAQGPGEGTGEASPAPAQPGAASEGAGKPATGEPKPGASGQVPEGSAPAQTEAAGKRDDTSGPDKIEAKPAPAKDRPSAAGEPDKQRGLMAELEDSLMKGLIGKKAFEKTRKLIKGK